MAQVGTILIREWQGKANRVTVLGCGVLFNGKRHRWRGKLRDLHVRPSRATGRRRQALRLCFGGRNRAIAGASAEPLLGDVDLLVCDELTPARRSRLYSEGATKIRFPAVTERAHDAAVISSTAASCVTGAWIGKLSRDRISGACSGCGFERAGRVRTLYRH